MKVLFATDGSVQSDSALATILGRTWPSGTQVHVLTVVEPVLLRFSMRVAKDQATRIHQTFLEEVQKMLADYGARLIEKFGQGAVSTELLEGHPDDHLFAHSAIVQKAKSWGSNLIVIGAHGGDEYAGSQLGGTAASVLRGSPCSVDIIKAPSLDIVATKASKNQPMAEHKLLVAVDNSVHGDAIVDSVLGQTWLDDSQFQILHIVESMHTHVKRSSSVAVREVADKALEHDTKQAQELVIQLAGKLKKRYQHVTHHVLAGSPRKIINHVADGWKADIVFVGSHGDHGIRDLVLGSVTDAVVSYTPCSVRVVKIAN